MSRAYEYTYELEAARRQQIYNERVSATTEQFYQRYKAQLEEMKRRGYAAYIPDEMERLQADLGEIRSLLTTSPEAAREVSFAVGSYIHAMHGLARAAEEQFERAQRLRQEAIRERERVQKDNLLNTYYGQVSKLSPTVAHFAQSELQALRQEIVSGSHMSPAELTERMESSIRAAAAMAARWRQEEAARHKKEEVSARLAEIEEAVTAEKFDDRQQTDAFTARIRQLKDDVETGRKTLETAESELAEISIQADDLHITEEIRRQTVIAIIQQLRSQDFAVSPPEIVTSGGESFVRVKARRPSGKQAMCQIDLHGRIQYKFDRYEGMTCLKDIEKFNIDLEKIYSVHLSDERVLWSNPDRLTKDEDRFPAGNDGRRQR